MHCKFLCAHSYTAAREAAELIGYALFLSETPGGPQWAAICSMEPSWHRKLRKHRSLARGLLQASSAIYSIGAADLKWAASVLQDHHGSNARNTNNSAMGIHWLSAQEKAAVGTALRQPPGKTRTLPPLGANLVSNQLEADQTTTTTNTAKHNSTAKARARAKARAGAEANPNRLHKTEVLGSSATSAHFGGILPIWAPILGAITAMTCRTIGWVRSNCICGSFITTASASHLRTRPQPPAAHANQTKPTISQPMPFQPNQPWPVPTDGQTSRWKMRMPTWMMTTRMQHTRMMVTQNCPPKLRGPPAVVQKHGKLPRHLQKSREPSYPAIRPKIKCGKTESRKSKLTCKTSKTLSNPKLMIMMSSLRKLQNPNKTYCLRPTTRSKMRSIVPRNCNQNWIGKN